MQKYLDFRELIPGKTVEVEQMRPQQVFPVHYSGGEDEKYYKSPQLSRKELQSWLNEQEPSSSEYILPSPGDGFHL